MVNRVGPQKTAASPGVQYTRLLRYKSASFLLLLETKFTYEDAETKKA